MLSDPPDPFEVEISLFGPGVGESLVIHLGYGDWIIVDSCIERGSKKAVALSYLDRIGVDISHQVKRVVTTHAHNDHIAGIATVFEACESAQFVHPEASGSSDFYALLDLDDMSDGSPKAYDEYRRVLETILLRKAAEKRAPRIGIKDGSLVFRRPATGSQTRAEVIALAPSDEAVRLAIQKFASWTRIQEQNPRMVAVDDPNTFCTVLLGEVGEVRFLLGSDLLIGETDDTGWKGVLRSPFKPAYAASYFKLPHHGAPNAHHPPVWKELLEEEPVATLTPYWKGITPRPQPADQARICVQTKSAYITCKPEFPAQPSRIQKDRAYLRSTARDVNFRRGFAGHVRCRRSFAKQEQWRVELVSPARNLCA